MLAKKLLLTQKIPASTKFAAGTKIPASTNIAVDPNIHASTICCWHIKILLAQNLLLAQDLLLAQKFLLALNMLLAQKLLMAQKFLGTGPRRQSVSCLATDACLTADPGVQSLFAALSHTFMEIGHKIISTVIQKKYLSDIGESMRTKYFFDSIHYVPSTIFQLYRDGSPWVEPLLG